MSTYKNQPFLKLTLRFGFIFLIVITILKIIFSIFNHGGLDGMIAEFFSADTWLLFVKMQLMMSALYGLFMAGYYKFVKK
ncbi:hypothetical protein [uncultured Lutibacter sp.]|uniref:hypothetical protein n=1 Tax=uncultured Lutibacter sp. TaxID=437739 RepID=UPI002632E977|nr:hypothetical protein [uncultured Lutibacter sp.]